LSFKSPGSTVAVVSTAGQQLTLGDAVRYAIENDLWINGNLSREAALLAESHAAGSLPDPRVSLGFANLPADSFQFDQENMTQLKVGISQSFPRGRSRELKRLQLEELSQSNPHLRKDRQARLKRDVSNLWLEGFRIQKSISLIEKTGVCLSSWSM
jgi:hypothetical protein